MARAKPPLLKKMSIVDEDAVPTIHHYRHQESVQKAKRPSLSQLHQRNQLKRNSESFPLTTSRLKSFLNSSTAEKAANTTVQNTSVHNTTVPNRSSHNPTDQSPSVSKQHKFGWIRGVLIRCILSILGTLLYLRLGWVAGNAGIILGTVIVLVSSLIVTLTALSMCALCTNGMISAGGAYYMLSRSLGPKFGGSMGVVFALADAVASAMNVVGFAETVQDLLQRHDISIVDPENDVRIIGAITMTVLFIIVMISVSWEAKTEIALLVVIIISYINYIVGTFIPPTETQRSLGITGYSLFAFKSNLMPHFREETFLTVFAVYFPSTTGIMAGAGISGELREPDKALPKGTLLGILITTSIYLSGVWFTGATCLRDASGLISEVVNGTFNFSCTSNQSCKFGLMMDNNIMEAESSYGPLLIAGIFATSISSALTLLVTSPRTIQALASDKLFPKTEFLAVLSGKDKEPRRAYVLVFLIALGIIAIGSLNAVAPLISNFYLASFALINLACFVGTISRSPGWRPAFRFYNHWVALIGGILCIVAMFVLNWYMALVTLLVMGVLYFFVHKNKPNVNWGASGPAQAYQTALHNLQRMAYTEGHVKNYRPQILLFSGNPLVRPGLITFVGNITKDISLLICGDIILKEEFDKTFEVSLPHWRRQIQVWFRRQKMKAFYNPTTATTFVDGFQSLLELAGLGHLKPDIVVLGYKQNWKDITVREETKNYYKMIHGVFSENLSLMIVYDHGFDLRDKESCTMDTILNDWEVKSPFIPRLLKKSETLTDQVSFHMCTNKIITESEKPRSVSESVQREDDEMSNEANNRTSVNRQCSNSSLADSMHVSNSALNISMTETVMDSTFTSANSLNSPHDWKPCNSVVERQVERKLDDVVQRFRKRVKNATVDVWWLYDDGGLTLLLSYLMTTERSYLKYAEIRLFVYAKNVNDTENEKKEMFDLLKKFRIRVVEIVILTDFDEPPKEWTVDEFYRMLQEFTIEKEDHRFKDHPDYYITKSELDMLKHKTYRQLRTRELIIQHSKDANLIIITMPVPKIGRESTCLYLAWLDMLTKNLTTHDTPVVLVRGNQQNVLTFYS